MREVIQYRSRLRVVVTFELHYLRRNSGVISSCLFQNAPLTAAARNFEGRCDVIDTGRHSGNKSMKPLGELFLMLLEKDTLTLYVILY